MRIAFTVMVLGVVAGFALIALAIVL